MRVDSSSDEHKSLVVVTSIPPSASPSQDGMPDPRLRTYAMSIGSLRTNGFEVISVNHPSEIDCLASSFPDVTFVGPGQTDGLFLSRYGPSLRAIFDVCQDQEFCGLVNSDIYMIGSDIADAVKRNNDIFHVARRMDVESLGGPIVGVYRRGIDFVLFNCRTFSPLFEDTNLRQFQLGAPFWDVVLPVVASFHGEVSFINPPFLLHPIHTTSWSNEDYALLRRAAVLTAVAHARDHAATRPKAASFLHAIERHVGDVDGLQRKKRIRMASAVMNAWLLHIERRHAQTIDVDFTDPIFQRSLKAYMASTDLGESIPDSPPKRADPISVGLRQLRFWRSERRFQRLMEEFEP